MCMPRSSDTLALSISVCENLSSVRPAAAVFFLRFSNNCNSQAKRFHDLPVAPFTVASRHCTAVATAKVSPNAAPSPKTGTAAVGADLYLQSPR